MDPKSSYTPIKLIFRDKLAERLGIHPRERLSLKIAQEGRLVAVSALVDGGDLTPGQTELFVAFLAECGLRDMVVMPERPVE